MDNSIKQKVIEAIADMSKKIERDFKHIYRNPITGEMYQGVSTVSSIVPKDWLAAWGAKECVKALGYTDYADFKLAEEIQTLIKSETIEQYIKRLRDAKGAHARKSKQAMVDGTKGHKWLESLVEARISGANQPLIPTDTLQRPIKQFLEWEAKEVDYWIASEAYVVRPDKSYAGQLDAIYVNKVGELCLVDFKFASHVSEDYWLQTAGYAACFEPYGIIFDKRVIIRLPKTLDKDEWDTKQFKYYKVPNDIEYHIVPTNYEGDKNAFFHALPLKQWINMVENMNKR